VMLPDPEKSENILVYALAATTKTDEVMVGGHYRFTISGDGKRVERADALSRSCMTLKKDKNVVGLAVTTLLDERPQETHVYLSLLHKISLSVITPKRAMWLVSDGKMLPLDAK